MIPKTIHYCWFGGNPLPAKEQKCIRSWKKFCPDYEIKRWDESNFDIAINSYVKEAYEKKKWAFVSDYARLYILYHEGGLYFDTDVELIKPIDDIINRGPFMAFEHGNVVALGLGAGAEAGMPVYKELIDYYDGIHFIGTDGLQNPGTIVSTVTDAMIKRGMRKVPGNQRVDGITIYKEEYFSPVDYRTGRQRITAKTRAVHHYQASWFSPAEKRIKAIQKRLVAVFGERIGVFLGNLISVSYKFINRIKKHGIKKTVGYYKRLIKWRKTGM